jgi:uncharacterized protein with PQ loop repeat
MNIKVQAGLVVAGIIATSVAVVTLLKLVVTNISPETMPMILIFLALGIAVYTLYGIALAQLKYEEKLKEISKK